MDKLLGVVLCVGLLGCGDGPPSLPNLPTFDLSEPADMATPDLLPLDGNTHAKFAASTVKLPTSSASYGYDLDGDGAADNRFGSILSALSALGLDVQAETDLSVANGSLLLLFDESSHDSTLMLDTTATLTLANGKKPVLPPKFDGTDVFVIDTTTAPAHFDGAITLGAFSSVSPAIATVPVTLTLVLPLFPNSAPLSLPITAGHASFTRSASGAITQGQLHGAVLKTDVDTVVLPAMAALLTTQIQLPGASLALTMFDTNGDGVVSTAELKSNALVANLFAPDVQLFQGGVYKPNPAKTTKDALSIGIAFTGKTASF